VRAGAALESALAFDTRRADVRDRVADLLFDRLLSVDGPDGALQARLSAYDPTGARLHRLLSRITVDSRPPGARVALARYSMEDGKQLLGPARVLGSAPTAVSVDAGSYVLSLELPGRSPTRLPVLVERGEPVAVVIELPLVGDVPDGFVYVPAGRFRYGAEDEGGLRTGFLRAQPVHEVTTDAYLIARHEVTYAQWIAFLDDLPAAERELRRPRGNRSTLSLELRSRDGRWHFELAMAGDKHHTYQAAAGEAIHYLQRDQRAVQDWTQFPVAGVTYGDAVEYTRWLDATGRLRGARLCSEHEWERAARGADDRIFPGGDRTDPDDMNHDRTYRRRPLAFGPDQVGSHPASRSPFDVDDLAGNVWEWVRRTDDGPPVSRGGSWYMGEIASRATNRNELEENLRAADYGLRVCATPR
jgi:formylglycine-generating enzyme required for sulfatase activity